MKKNIALLLALTLVFAFALTGCGGGTDEPVVEDQAQVEQPAEITANDLAIKYNEVATLYNEVYTLANEKGVYGVDETTTGVLDDTNGSMVELGTVIQGGDLTAEEIPAFYDALDQLGVTLDSMKTALETL